MTTVIDGIKINYETRGEGECILFLHGWGANIKLFDGLMETVSKKYCAAALDLPGFGESEEPSTPWSVDDYVSFVIKFTQETGLSPVALVGHSFGGRLMIKLLAGGLMPSVKKAVFMDAAGIKPKKSLKQKVSLIAYKTGRRIMSIPPMKTLFPDAVENMRKKRGSADYNSATPVMRQTLVKVVNEDLTPLLKDIKVPSLLIWGTLDTATPISDGETFERMIPDAGLVRIEGGSHFAFLQAPEICSRAISSFFGIPY